MLTKQTPDDDIETYIALFERTAARENWPRAACANNLLPFLTGGAQKDYGRVTTPRSMSRILTLRPTEGERPVAML